MISMLGLFISIFENLGSCNIKHHSLISYLLKLLTLPEMTLSGFSSFVVDVGVHWQNVIDEKSKYLLNNQNWFEV